MLCVTSFTIFAQEPEQIDLGPYGTLLVRTNKKPIEYFETQMKLWEKKVKQNKKDANAWLNYFAATKCAYQIELSKLLEDSKPGTGIDMTSSKFQFTKIATVAYKEIPNTFEGNYIMHNRDYYHLKLDYTYLLKAQELKPFDQRILWSLLVYYEGIQDLQKSMNVAKELSNTSIIKMSELNNAYNILTEIEENALFVSGGYEEYMACLILQKLKNIKPNAIITTNFIIRPCFNNIYKYTENTLVRLNISTLKKYDYDTINKQKITLIPEDEQLEPLKSVINTGIPVYFSNRIINETLHSFGDKLYIHGLTYRYSDQPVNYIFKIKENYEKNYSLDFIKHDISPTLSDFYEQSLYYMYYPSALKLYEFYKEKEMYLQQQEMKKFIQVLSEKSGKEFFKNNDLFKENENVTYSRAEIDFKKLEASFVALNTAEHIGKFEVTNGEYNLFLKNLKQSKNYELYYKCLIDSIGWERTFDYAPVTWGEINNGNQETHPKSYHTPMTNLYGWHPAYSNYPVVNIPYEGAVEYCKWLTVQYNQQHPEGKYVSFRLPTEKEWRYAAGSKNEKAITPFPNDNIITKDPKSFGLKNTHISRLDGTEFSICYLGNIKTDSTHYADDGGFHTVKSESYTPNPLGIYNVFGNVAEMTSTKGVIKGGSWADLFSECTFDKNATYSAPDPRVGFRIMMEVVPSKKK